MLDYRDCAGHREGEVDVGEPIARPDRERPDDRTGDDAVIRLSELHYLLTERIALSDGVHPTSVVVVLVISEDFGSCLSIQFHA